MSVANAPDVRRGRLWPWLVGVLLFLLIIGSILVLSTGTTANRRLAVAMSAADRDDPHWRLDDLLEHREQVPDAENSALVLAQSIALLGKNWPNASVSAAGVPTAVPPTAASTKAARALDELDDFKDNERLNDVVARVLRNELKMHEQALSLARSVKDYRRGRNAMVLGPNLIDTLLPQTQEARTVSQLLKADAAVRANDGDLDGALDTCQAILGTARSMGDEPMLISQLVRNGIDGVAVKAIRRVLGQGEPSDSALLRVQDLILDELAQPLLLTGINGERAFMTELIRRVEGGEVALSTITGSSNPPTAGARAGNNVFAILSRGVFGGQRAVALEWMNEAVAISRRPAPEQRDLFRSLDAKIAAVHMSRFERFTNILPLLLVPAVTSAGNAFHRGQAELGATAILIAAERQRRRTGKWPASIEAIDRSILREPPVDPFSGKPFHLEYRGGEFVIYSIGPNGKDEHGAFDRKRNLQGAPDDLGARAWDVSLRRQSPEEEQD